MIEELAKLIIIEGENIGDIYEIVDDATLIGRGSYCEILINDQAASRRHSIISYENGKYIIQDNASRNGTKVNDRKVKNKILKNGDKITIGTTVFLFECEVEEDTSMVNIDDEYEYEDDYKMKKRVLDDSSLQYEYRKTKKNIPVIKTRRFMMLSILFIAVCLLAVTFVKDRNAKLVTELMKEGNQFAQKGMYEKAIMRWEEVLGIQPDNKNARMKIKETNKLLAKQAATAGDDSTSVEDITPDIPLSLKELLEKAEYNYNLGMQYYEERKLKADNLYQAITIWEEALIYLVEIQPKSELQITIEEQLIPSKVELDGILEDYEKKAFISIQQNNNTIAKDYLVRIIRTLPDPNDSRYVFAKEKLLELK